MGSDEEKPDPITMPKLPLFSMSTPHDLTEPSGTSTPPFQTSASVPFQWEEQPGKPRPCMDIILASTINPTRPDRCLELPPRLTIIEPNNIITKTTSPTTVLDGPGDFGGKSVFSYSFRFAKERRRQVSFDSNCSGGWSPNDDVLLLGSNNKQEKMVNYDGKGLFGPFRLRGKDDKGIDDKGSFVISPSSKSTIETVGYFFEEKKGKRMRRNSSLSKFNRSNFWASIYEGFKQVVVPWRKKAKKESFIL